MELQSTTDFLHNKTILVTGATGFLAKILVEKILRAQPNVKKLYLLIRVKDNKSVLKRLHDEIINKDLFKVVRETQGANFDSFISEKVCTIAGDTSLPNFGMNNNNLCMEVDAIVHVAASTNFNERYDWAFGTNTLGIKHVIDFAKKCSKLQILVHVSTAYVCREGAGLIKENICKMDETLNGRIGLDVDEEMKLIDKTLDDLTRKGSSTKKIRDAMRRLGRKRASLYGWPNTYVFTKAMGEMLMENLKGDLPVVINRPTLICSTYKEPFPGWIESDGSAAVVTIWYGKQLFHLMHVDPNAVMDLIPADMVVNSILVAMAANANRPSLTIYQVGSSLRNPIKMSKLLHFNFVHFKNHPWTDDEGTPVIVPIWTKILVKSKLIFIMFLALHFLMLLVLKFLDISSGHNIKLMNLDKFEMRLKVTVKVAEMFRPYGFFPSIFDDENTEQLRLAMSKIGKENEEQFGFDPKNINWEDYLLNVHIPAIVKYMF